DYRETIWPPSPARRRGAARTGWRARVPCLAPERRLHAPLHRAHDLGRDLARAPGGIHEIAVGPVLDRMTPRIGPVVENLAAEIVAADAPFMLARFRGEIFLAAHQIVEIDHFERGMTETGPAFDQSDGVMIDRHRAAVAAHEGAARIFLGPLVRRDDAEPRLPPFLRAREIADAEHEMAEPLDMRRALPDALRIVLARIEERIVGRKFAPHRDLRRWRAFGDDLQPVPVGVLDRDHLAAARPIEIVDRGIFRLGQFFEI